jgi:ABC-2 type transport system ATP-binding protein
MIVSDSLELAFEALTKDFGGRIAVDGLTATVRPGVVTAFLGPNGAGKTTTLRMLLGLVTPTSGRATIGGRRYADLADPVRSVGAMLEAGGFHPGRSAASHLRCIAVAAQIASDRSLEVLDQVGLGADADRKVGEYSLGMRQRLALGCALLGDPGVLVLDEPANGLDPQGIRWLRGLLRELADEGRTVLVSSHLLAEVEQTADDVLLLANGRLIRQAALSHLRAESEAGAHIRTPAITELTTALNHVGVVCRRTGPDALFALAPAAVVGEIAATSGIALHGLTETSGALEDVFMSLTREEALA